MKSMKYFSVIKLTKVEGKEEAKYKAGHIYYVPTVIVKIHINT